jgi:hypothetical protein
MAMAMAMDSTILTHLIVMQTMKEAVGKRTRMAELYHHDVMDWVAGYDYLSPSPGICQSAYS